MYVREPGIDRLYPSIFGRMATRYYYLRQLRQAIEDVIAKFVAPSPVKLVLADYGCGNKPYESLIAPFVDKYIGIDLPANQIADIHITPEGTIALPEGNLDVVLSTQALEHVVNPLFYLSEARRVLKDDGMLILSTHGYWMFHPDPTDFWRWTSTGLQKIVTDSGFEVIYFKGIIGRAAMGIQLFQDAFTFRVPKPLRPLLALILQPLIYVFDKTTRQRFKDRDACTFILVARKVQKK
ncbi:class I SAM-dependent methyltransferase [Dyadobacter sp. CY343]|uniref:class I SAM-dependent methyltransferase n=1 Tax=Dyadobacter sp. CY343 TaxID=2907299 RepID=UPI001F19CFA8|nr:class I SAM-dependent methyltransferase [Dyadobacter sp. CY343]MCE7058634.1 class I SAM-dependent methyltransferase [Dyadobacter sp. CY343]